MLRNHKHQETSPLKYSLYAIIIWLLRKWIDRIFRMDIFCVQLSNAKSYVCLYFCSKLRFFALYEKSRPSLTLSLTKCQYTQTHLLYYTHCITSTGRLFSLCVLLNENTANTYSFDCSFDCNSNLSNGEKYFRTPFERIFDVSSSPNFCSNTHRI